MLESCNIRLQVYVLVIDLQFLSVKSFYFLVDVIQLGHSVDFFSADDVESLYFLSKIVAQRVIIDFCAFDISSCQAKSVRSIMGSNFFFFQILVQI